MSLFGSRISTFFGGTTSGGGGGSVGGSGTTNYVAKWVNSTDIGNSSIFDNGTSVGIGTNTPTSTYKLDVVGNIFSSGFLKAGLYTTLSSAGTSGALSLNSSTETLKMLFGNGGVGIADFVVYDGNYMRFRYQSPTSVPLPTKLISAETTITYSSGTNSHTIFGAIPTMNTSGGTNTIRGFYYAPSITSDTGNTHVAFQNTIGDVIFGNLSSLSTQMVIADSNGKLSVQPIPNFSGGGASISYYLNGGTSQGSFGGTTYYQMSKNAIIGSSANFTIATNGYIASFITDVNDPSLLNIPSGNWNCELYFSASSSGGSPSFYLELYKYDGATFTLIASNSTNPEVITNATNVDLYTTTLAVPSTTLTITDRLAIRVYVNNGGRTITLHTQDGTLCQIITTFTTGITALNGLTPQVQTFAVGTSGTDFAISSSSSTHTFNLPSASSTNRGALTSADWTTMMAQITLTSFQQLGSTLKGITLSCPDFKITTGGAIGDGTIRLVPVYVPVSATITGVRFFQGTQGAYTADNYNGVGLYSQSSGTLTLQASSTNDGNIWKGTTNTWQTKAFTTPFSASGGTTYYVAALYNTSAETTPPTIGCSPSLSNVSTSALIDFTNNNKLSVTFSSQTSLASPLALSSSGTSNIMYGLFLY
jgi:hypothetical protein